MTCRVHLGECYLAGLSVTRWARAHLGVCGVVNDRSGIEITVT
jgi:hypothetical protein